MTSQAQILANRKNALKSTGPKTPEGKAISSQNSIKHGLLTQAIHCEKKEELDLLRAQLHQALQPEGALEQFLVEKILNAAWRLQRVMQVEISIFDAKDYCSSIKLKDIFWGNHGICMQNLSRYESTLERNFYKALHELQRVQAQRLGQTVVAPIAVEVNCSGEGSGFVL